MRTTKEIIIATVLAAICAGCEMNTGEGTVVGSTNDTAINGVVFSVDTTYLEGHNPVTMVAKGKARNAGGSSISSPWYVEGQFFTDAAYSTKLGGSNVQVGVPLSPGQQTLWTLKFTSSNTDLGQYPGFRVGELRAVYK